MSLADFSYEFARLGFVKFKSILVPEATAEFRQAIDAAIAQQAGIHSQGQFAHILHTMNDRFLDLVNHPPVWPYVCAVLGDEAILHSFSGINLVPSIENPIQNAIHRDTPRFSRPYLLSCQLLIMVDQFTEDNGATWVLPASHQLPEKPTDEQFAEGAVQLLGDPGDVVLFDSLLWHRGGHNKTTEARRAMTMVFTRSFIKQQFEMTSTLAATEREKLNDVGLQLLGFRSKPPRTIEEFSLPREQRSYVARD